MDDGFDHPAMVRLSGIGTGLDGAHSHNRNLINVLEKCGFQHMIDSTGSGSVQKILLSSNGPLRTAQIASLGSKFCRRHRRCRRRCHPDRHGDIYILS